MDGAAYLRKGLKDKGFRSKRIATVGSPQQIGKLVSEQVSFQHPIIITPFNNIQSSSRKLEW